MTDTDKIQLMADAIEQIVCSEMDYDVARMWSDGGCTVELVFTARGPTASGNGPYPYAARLSFPLEPSGVPQSIALEEDEDSRQVWVVAREVPPIGKDNIPRQQWEYMELWLSEDPLLTVNDVRIGRTPAEVDGWLHKWGLAVDLERGPVAQVAKGIVLGTFAINRT